LPPETTSCDHSSTFDEYAESYDLALNQGLALSGESKEYFARRRVEWVARRLRDLGVRPRSVLDFGCGTGSSVPFLRDLIQAGSVTGLDISPRSVAVARRAFGSDRVEFVELTAFGSESAYDLAFCNGVFHHISPAERPAAVALVHRALRPGGLFAFWENNPWNPGTRWVMSRIPFDRDAVPLAAPEAQRLLRGGGFEILGVDFLFIFPRLLGSLRSIEPRLARLPLGAQYLVLGRKAI
jgi:SAM-dependent methyltransferase